jgi:hypothetical protein
MGVSRLTGMNSDAIRSATHIAIAATGWVETAALEAELGLMGGSKGMPPL